MVDQPLDVSRNTKVHSSYSQQGTDVSFTRAQRQSGRLFDPSRDTTTLRSKVEVSGSPAPQTASPQSYADSPAYLHRSRRDQVPTGFGKRLTYGHSPIETQSSPFAFESEKAFGTRPNQTPFATFSEPDSGNYIRQPETKPISQEQLVSEVKGRLVYGS